MLLPGHKQWGLYQEAVLLTKAIYRLTALFPDSERTVLVHSLRRTSITLCQHIALAAAKTGKKKKRSLQAALDHCVVLDTQLELAQSTALISAAETTEAEAHLRTIVEKLVSLL